MKYNNLRAFEKHLEEASTVQFPSIYMVIAKDAFERNGAVETLLKHLLKEEKKPELCSQVFDGDHLNISSLFDELFSSTLFSPKKVVVVKFSDTPAAAIRSAIETRLEKIGSGTTFIMAMASINHSTNFYKKSEKSGVILEIPESKPWEREKILAEWVNSRLNQLGKRIQPDACQLLVKQVEGQLALLHNELEKLLCYIGDRNEIVMQDVRAICTHNNVETVWQLGEAIFRRDVAAALRITKALLLEENSLIGFLRQLRGQFQTEFQICSILASGGHSQEVMQLFPYMKGAILERHMRLAQEYGLPSFKKGMQQIDSTELMAKNSVADNDVLAELLIIKLTRRT